MRISDWSSDVCSSDLVQPGIPGTFQHLASDGIRMAFPIGPTFRYAETRRDPCEPVARSPAHDARQGMHAAARPERSDEHTSEPQSLMRISYAVFCLKKKKIKKHTAIDTQTTPKNY